VVVVVVGQRIGGFRGPDMGDIENSDAGAHAGGGAARCLDAVRECACGSDF
jgi:hypothetical protein